MKELIKPTKPHKHANYFELIFLHAGSGFHVIDDEQHEINAPAVFFLKPNQTHCWDFTSIPKGYVILFKEEIFSSDVPSLFDIPAYTVLNNGAFVKVLLADLFETGASHGIVSSYLNVLLHHIKNNGNSMAEISVNQDPLAALFKRLLNTHFKELKLVSEYAALLNITPGKLNEVCKKSFNRSANDLIKERLFLESKVLLIHTNKSVGEIAFNLNFTDASHFNKFFSAHAKVTPGQYRKMKV